MCDRYEEEQEATATASADRGETLDLNAHTRHESGLLSRVIPTAQTTTDNDDDDHERRQEMHTTQKCSIRRSWKLEAGAATHTHNKADQHAVPCHDHLKIVQGTAVVVELRVSGSFICLFTVPFRG